VYLFTRSFNITIIIFGIDALIKVGVYLLNLKTKTSPINKINGVQPVVIWLTGLPGAGKSTIATGIYEALKERGLKVEHLDGDMVRNIFPKTGFTKEERDRHIKRIGFLASMLEKNGINVVASFISPYKISRDFVRSLCTNYLEIYISTPIEECERRDPKGLYQKARAGLIKNFTGIDDPYEPPENPHLTLDTTELDISESIKIALKSLNL
jgi:adenylylsulfate kinase